MVTYYTLYKQMGSLELRSKEIVTLGRGDKDYVADAKVKIPTAWAFKLTVAHPETRVDHTYYAVALQCVDIDGTHDVLPDDLLGVIDAREGFNFDEEVGQAFTEAIVEHTDVDTDGIYYPYDAVNVVMVMPAGTTWIPKSPSTLSNVLKMGQANVALRDSTVINGLIDNNASLLNALKLCLKSKDIVNH